MVFTATIGQELWRATIEEKGKDEKFKQAFKRQVTMYDCLLYKDGQKSPWTIQRIEEIKAGCRSDAEIQRRVYGRFIRDTNLMYPNFVRRVNTAEPTKLDREWLIYLGCDIGSGGKNHPASVAIIAVNKEFTEARVIDGWRGDGKDSTTASDVLEKCIELRGKLKPIAQYYDHSARDFKVIADRIGEPFIKAEKDRAAGEKMLNVLFKHKMLTIDKTPELDKLMRELESLTRGTAKSNAKDDFIDALRFAVTNIPWDYHKIYSQPKKKQKQPHMERREAHYKGLDEEDFIGLDLLEAEMDEASLLDGELGFE